MGRYDLGLDEEAFWDLTPRAFALLLDRHEEAERRADARMAIAVFHLLGPHLRPGARIRPADLYPSLKPAPPRPATTPHEIAQIFRSLTWHVG